MSRADSTKAIDLASIVSVMNRRALVYHLQHMDPGFKLDFTPEFLATRSVEQLRHMLLAVYHQAEVRRRRNGVAKAARTSMFA